MIQNKKNLNYILVCTIFVFIFKWLFSYYFFKDDISIKIIFDFPNDGYFYYIYPEALSNLNFNKSFDNNVANLKNIPTPFYAAVLPAIMFNIFGGYSFLFLEFICIFLFILIFFKIFKKLQFSNSSSILIAIFIFCIPTIINFLQIDSLPYMIALDEIYGLRFPRPLVSNIFFYLFILYFLIIDEEKIFTKKNMIYLALILSFSLSSFYYFFMIEILAFTIFVFYKLKLSEIISLKNLNLYFLFIYFFGILMMPFVYFVFSAEPDYMERLFVTNFTFEKKIILLKYLISKLFSLNVILLITIISLLNIYSSKFKMINYQKIKILYILFLSSLLAPFVFILISNKNGINYHFINSIVICTFLYLLIFCFSFLKEKIVLKSNFNLINYLIFFLIIFFYNFHLFNSFKKKNSDNDYVSYRTGFKNITDLIKTNKNVSLLTFDSRLMVWAILNDVNEIKPLSGQLVSKTHLMIENDLIDSFKFLKLDYSNFSKFFENQLSTWRITNHNTKLFFWGRYSASKLQTYKNSKDFSKEETKIINNTSPLNVQSIAIPKNEIERLKRKFEKRKINEEFQQNVIFLHRNKFSDNFFIEDILECKKISNKKIIAYSKLNNNSKC